MAERLKTICDWRCTQCTIAKMCEGDSVLTELVRLSNVLAAAEKDNTGPADAYANLLSIITVRMNKLVVAQVLAPIAWQASEGKMEICRDMCALIALLEDNAGAAQTFAQTDLIVEVRESLAVLCKKELEGLGR